MSLKYGILCLLLVCLIGFFTFKNYEIWTHSMEAMPEKGSPKKSEKKSQLSPMTASKKDPKAIESNILISEKNIFHPERKDFPIMATGPGIDPLKKPAVRPQVILSGVTIMGDYESASIINPGRSLKKGERETMTLKVGDRIGEYKLAKILADRIIFEAEEDTLEVLLYDPKAPKKRMDIKTVSKPATVTSTLPTPATPSTEPSKPLTPAPPSREQLERAKEAAQERVAPSPQLPRATSPSFPPAATRRGTNTMTPSPISPQQDIRRGTEEGGK